MQPKIVNRDAFRVMGVVGHFESTAENFGPLWQEYMTFHEQIEPLGTGEGHYGIYLGDGYIIHGTLFQSLGKFQRLRIQCILVIKPTEIIKCIQLCSMIICGNCNSH